MSSTCVFCEIVADEAPASRVQDNTETLIFRPLGPVVEGHVLVVPKVHVGSASADPYIAAVTMLDAATYARSLDQPFNIITSAGKAATQSIFHLHLHVVPRAPGDSLMVPWGTLQDEDPHAPHRCRRIQQLEQERDGLRRELAALARAPRLRL